MRVDDLLSEGKWSVKTATNDSEVLCEFPESGQYSLLYISPFVHGSFQELSYL